MSGVITYDVLYAKLKDSVHLIDVLWGIVAGFLVNEKTCTKKTDIS